jgi:hypothetical protein
LYSNGNKLERERIFPRERGFSLERDRAIEEDVIIRGGATARAARQ